ncbi:hypothetical protein TNCV_4339711 [Trichonephila clavipes]|nr:hypothetical protein TNCV_4339711 [Trichonephila clavipes]
MSDYSATRGRLGTDIVALNHDQVMRTTPELAPPSRNFHIKPTGEPLSLDIFNVHQPSLNGGSSAKLDNDFELMASVSRVPAFSH